MVGRLGVARERVRARSVACELAEGVPLLGLEDLIELDHALRKLRLSGMADTLETRLLEAQSESQAPIDMVSALVGDELVWVRR